MILHIVYQNGIFKAELGGNVLGQGRNIETMLENATHQTFSQEAKFMASEVLLDLLGPLAKAGNTQIGTREP